VTDDAELAAEMAELAAALPETAHRIDPAVSLDYSPQSLQTVDEIITAWWPPRRGLFGKKPNIPDEETIAAIGAYAGEVIVRNLGGRWTMNEELDAAGVDVDGTVAFPFSKTFKRFANGEEDSLWSLYRVLDSGVLD
jgi:hypothetical protein